MDYLEYEPPVRRSPGRRRTGPAEESANPLKSGFIDHGRVGVDDTSSCMGDDDGFYSGETPTMKRITNHSQT